MKNKLFFSIIFVIAMSISAFAQQKFDYVGLTDSDVKNFAKNYEVISQGLDKYDIDPKDTLNPTKQAEKIYDQVISFLNKNGISGDNALEKVKSICFHAGVAGVEYQMNTNPTVAAQMKAAGIDLLATYRAMMDEKDYKVVSDNFELLKDKLELDK